MVPSKKINVPKHRQGGMDIQRERLKFRGKIIGRDKDWVPTVYERGE